MMPSYIVLAIASWVAYLMVSTYLGFRRNLAAAKRSGIPYVVVPVYYLNRWWLITHGLYLPLLARLPRRWTEWVDVCVPDFNYVGSIEIFQRLGQGHDTFLAVAPGGMVMHTAEPAVISQITARRNDFPKPTAIYKSLDIYGKNVVSSEGAMWRQHRKAVSPPFTEKNNHLVWTESIELASAMLASWVDDDSKAGTVDRVMDDTMRLSLYVISRAGFGRKLQWPSLDDAKASDVDVGYVDESKIQNQRRDRDPGHSMSYTYAIHCLLDNILLQFLLPRTLLERVPLKAFQKANEAYREWGNYMKEAVASKKESIEAGAETKDQMDIISQLVKNQMTTSDKSRDVPLTDSEILGNMFVVILAGHETAANSIHFSLIYMALQPDIQRAVQKDLDRIFQGRPPAEWDYDRDLPSLFGGMVGAVLAEELRLVPPVIGIPKSTYGVGDQPLTVGGKPCTVPGDIYISLAAATVQRNPKYWPTGKPTLPGGSAVHPVANLDNDLEEFHPERWLLDEREMPGPTKTTTDGQEMPNETVTTDGLGVNEAADTSERLYRPPKGAYVPFSEGYRACLGRRFAQVEVLAVLAVLLQTHSVELAVDGWATDDEVVAMDEDARVEVWQQAAVRARDLMLNGLGVIISLQMRKGHVPLRFVPRGRERFPDDVDEKWKAKHPGEGRGSKPIPDWRFWA